MKVSDVYQFLTGTVFALYLGVLAVLSVVAGKDSPWWIGLVLMVLISVELWLAAKGLHAILTSKINVNVNVKVEATEK